MIKITNEKTRQKLNALYHEQVSQKKQDHKAEAKSNIKQTKVCILVRVSTNQQDTDRQITELKEYANKQNYEVVEVCEETISGTSDEAERTGLHRALELAKSGKIQKILVHEVSRLARKNSIAHKFVEDLESYGVSLYWKSQNIETLLQNGKRNPAAAIMFALLAEMARNERETLVQRIKSGLAEAKRKGKKLGRPQGTKTSKSNYLAKHKDIIKNLRKGISIRNTAKITGKGISTVQRVKLAMV